MYLVTVVVREIASADVLLQALFAHCPPCQTWRLCERLVDEAKSTSLESTQIKVAKQFMEIFCAKLAVCILSYAEHIFTVIAVKSHNSADSAEQTAESSTANLLRLDGADTVSLAKQAVM